MLTAHVKGIVSLQKIMDITFCKNTLSKSHQLLIIDCFES